MVVRLSAYFGIEGCDQCCRYSGRVSLDDCSDLRKKRFHVLLRRRHQHLAVVRTYVLSEKVGALLDVGDSGLCFGKNETTVLHKRHHQRLDPPFERFLAAAHDDESDWEAENEKAALGRPVPADPAA